MFVTIGGLTVTQREYSCHQRCCSHVNQTSIILLRVRMLMKSERATASVIRLLLPRDNTKQSVSVELNIK